MSGSNKPTAGFAVWAGKAAGNLFFVGLLVAWFAAVNTALDNVNEGLGWVVDRAIHWVTPTPAKGADFAAPSEGEFFARLMQPDQPKTSCCGAADAYWADRTEPCLKEDGPACWLRAVITDTRPDKFEVTDADGKTKTITRAHIPDGTRIVVMANKRRTSYSENPTDHGVIFVANPAAFDDSGEVSSTTPKPNGFTVYCFEPLALL